MRRFLLHALLFGTLALLGIGAYVWSYRHFLPAPRISPNGALNLKLSDLRHRGAHPCNVLALGSSMTLNNLSSPDVVAHFQDTSYVNMGAWGLDIKQCNSMAHVLVPLMKPRTVIVMGNLSDAVPDVHRHALDTARVTGYLLRWSTPEAYLRSLRPAYYLREMERNRIRMLDRSNYEFMNVDEHGWAPLVIPPDRIDRGRWERTPPKARWLSSGAYDQLADLGRYLREQGVRLVYIQSPYRAGVRTADVDTVVQGHVRHVRNLLEPLGHAVLDATDRRWEDSLFVDYSHLNEEGARLVTAHALAQLNALRP
jgi:hypothetical protein